jgi:hypothetical protein
MPFERQKSSALRQPEEDRNILYLTFSRFATPVKTPSPMNLSTRLLLATALLAVVLVFVYVGADLIGPIVSGR